MSQKDKKGRTLKVKLEIYVQGIFSRLAISIEKSLFWKYVIGSKTIVLPLRRHIKRLTKNTILKDYRE